MDLVTIIVSVYNAEKYLSKCIESIINQTYRNLEIILINDASTDKSLDICTEYENKDRRIKVINLKENVNGNINKNIALDHSNGYYIVFIDNDDWIENNMIEVLYKLITSHDACLSACDFIEVYDDEFLGSEGKKGYDLVYKDLENQKILVESNTDISKKSDIFILDRNEALLSMYRTCKVVVWNKMYKKEIFDKVRFYTATERYGYGDERITYKILDNCKKIVYTNEQLYYYRQRKGSVMNSGFTIKRLDALGAFIDRIDYFEEKDNRAMVDKSVNMLFRYIDKIMNSLNNIEIENKENIIYQILLLKKDYEKKYGKKV